VSLHRNRNLLQKILFKDKLARRHIEKEEYADAAKVLLRHQRLDWNLLKASYEALADQKIKEFEFDGFKVKVQFNPGRIHSTSAEVDEESINNRECFLCNENRPVEQKAIQYKKDYLIICNPYPILPEHFTISHINHTPQRIKKSFSEMLSLAKDLSKYYNVFYNGPECGASAPDHLHFQSGTKSFFPIEGELILLRNEFGTTLSEDLALAVTGVDDGLRKFILIEGKKERDVQYAFDTFYKVYKMISAGNVEPMMNIVTTYIEKKGWKVILYMRSKHRPACYFKEGKEKILLSPASTDLSGICVTPREEDFDKITKDDIIKIFHEVSIGKEQFEFMKSGLERRFE
jgi:Domain of unknown function (DUF4922)